MTKEKNPHRNPRWAVILFGAFVACISLIFLWFVGNIGYFFVDVFFLYDIKSKRIAKDFYEESAATKGLKVTSFRTFDGDGVADLEIEGKGKVWMWYHGKDGSFSMSSFGGYSTSFPCIALKRNGDIGYGGEMGMTLSKGSPYLKWFPQVNSLQELVDKYDDIIASLERLPKNPELVEYSDPLWKGKRYTLKHHNEDYRIYRNENILTRPVSLVLPGASAGRIACDLFTGPHRLDD